MRFMVHYIGLNGICLKLTEIALAFSSTMCALVHTDFVILYDVQIAWTLLIFDTQHWARHWVCHMSWTHGLYYRAEYFFFLKKYEWYRIYTCCLGLWVEGTWFERVCGISINPFAHSKLIYSVPRRVLWLLMPVWRFEGWRQTPHIKMEFSNNRKKERSWRKVNNDRDDVEKRLTQSVYCSNFE